MLGRKKLAHKYGYSAANADDILIPEYAMHDVQGYA